MWIDLFTMVCEGFGNPPPRYAAFASGVAKVPMVNMPGDPGGIAPVPQPTVRRWDWDDFSKERTAVARRHIGTHQ